MTYPYRLIQTLLLLLFFCLSILHSLHPHTIMFHSWPQLPAELKLRVLEFALSHPKPIENWSRHAFCGKPEMESILRTRNQELVVLALEACQYT